MRRFVVAGAGRSGTLYISKVLSELGIPCSHEKLFRPSSTRWPENFTSGEASWHVVPFLDSRPDDVLVVHQVRSPLAVIASLYGREFFRYPASTLRWLPTWRRVTGGERIASGRRDCITFLEREMPAILKAPDEISRCIRYWTAMNTVTEASAAHLSDGYLRLRIGDLGPRTIRRILDALGEVGRTDESITAALEAGASGAHKSNAAQRARAHEVDLEFVELSADWPAARELAQRYGLSAETFS